MTSYAACKFTTKCNRTGEVTLETQTGKEYWEETFMETVKVSWGECGTCKRVCEATEKDSFRTPSIPIPSEAATCLSFVVDP
eukprot:12087670-Ditylum_brightwellii.AAC.1